jgi:hypothetical protein
MGGPIEEMVMERLQIVMRDDAYWADIGPFRQPSDGPIYGAHASSRSHSTEVTP